MFLSSFSFVEPKESMLLYYPSWLNIWESFAYKNALKSTVANGWGFKRFGTIDNAYIGERTRKSNYISYVDAMEKASDLALYQLAAKERMLLLRSRTAFIYVDSWGETSPFEENVSALHASAIDTLPKNLVKTFSVNDVTCKIRGENNSLIQAMRLAQDYLNWDIFDFVIICGGFRAIPVLTFSAENIHSDPKIKKSWKTPDLNISIERAGCFIFSQRESQLKINCGPYIDYRSTEPPLSEEPLSLGIDLLATVGDTSNIPPLSAFNGKRVDLVKTYGRSGCLTPALSWQYIANHALSGGCIRTILPVKPGGYTYFDTWY